MAYGVSNGHVTDDVTGAVRQYGRLSYRQLGFLVLILLGSTSDICIASTDYRPDVESFISCNRSRNQQHYHSIVRVVFFVQCARQYNV